MAHGRESVVVFDRQSYISRHASDQHPLLKALVQTGCFNRYLTDTARSDNACLRAKSGWTSSSTCAGNVNYCQLGSNAAYRADVLSCCPSTCRNCTSPLHTLDASNSASSWTTDITATLDIVPNL